MEVKIINEPFTKSIKIIKNNMSLEQIKPYLEQITDKLGQGAGFTWDVVLKQQYIDGLLSIFWIVVGIALGIATYKGARYCWKKHQEDKYSDWELGATIFGIIGGVFTIVLIVFNFESAINHLVNPEYQAIMDLIGSVK